MKQKLITFITGFIIYGLLFGVLMYFSEADHNLKAATEQGLFFGVLWDFLILLYYLKSMLILPIEIKNNKMNLKNSQLEVDNWIKNHGVRYFNELTNMAQLTEEVGEVARIIARRYGEQSEKDSDKNKDLGEELADVVFVVLCLANQTGIDLQSAFDKKMDLKTNRDHDRHHNNEKLK